ncbi:YggN family protein [Neptunicella marina]|uniref:YggN family protein n=2 Tax=Neptunicella marina TaxID=2125989 RepID=A0A8J6M2L5_9ALTE|nr:YggN family protein [Neptunicella marina]
MTSCLLLVSSSCFADFECDMDLQQGILVNDNQIRIVEDYRTLYQINGDNQLIVQGDWLMLNEQQNQLLAEFSHGIHYAMPKMVLLATEGVDIAISTVENVYLGLVGEDHTSYKRLSSALKRVKRKVGKKFIHTEDYYYIGPRSLENVDLLVDAKMEEEIEHAIKTSIGGILSAIAGLTSDGDAQTQQRMDNLSLRLETMGAEIERQVGPRAQTLRNKAKWFCGKMKRLDDVENQLRKSIPQLQPFDVIVTGHQVN